MPLQRRGLDIKRNEVVHSGLQGVFLDATKFPGRVARGREGAVEKKPEYRVGLSNK